MTLGGRFILALVFGGLVFLPFLYLLLTSSGTEAWGELWSALSESTDQELIANSIWLALLTTAFALVLGIPLGLLVGLRRFPLRRLILALVAIPLLIPPHIHAISWARVTGDRGWLTLWLASVSDVRWNVRAPLGDPRFDPILGHLYPGPAWVMACAYFPLIVAPLIAGLRRLDPDTLIAAKLCGASRLRILTRIVFPSVARHLFAGAAFVFLLAFSTYPVVSLLDTPTLIQRVVFVFSQVDQRAGVILGLPLVLLGLAMVFVLTRAGQGIDVRSAGDRVSAGRGSLFDLILALLILALAFLVPLVSLIYQAGPIRFGASEIDNYRSVFPRITDALTDSLTITGMSAVVILSLGLVVASVMARSRSLALDVLSFSLLALPPVVTGVALVVFTSDLANDRIQGGPLLLASCLVGLVSFLPGGSLRVRLLGFAGSVLTMLAFPLLFSKFVLGGAIYSEGPWLVVWAQIPLVLPFVVRVLRNAFGEIDRDEVDAARLVGHGPISTFLAVELPRLRPALSATLLIAYVLVFTELAASLMTLRPGWQSVQVRIFNMVHYQSIGEVAALCVIVVVLAFVPVAVALLVPRPKDAIS